MCKFCKGKLLHVNAKCVDSFQTAAGDGDWTEPDYNSIPGLMVGDGSGDYICFSVCFKCERLQEPLFGKK